MADSTLTWTDQIRTINQSLIDAEIMSTMFESDPVLGIFLSKAVKKGYFGTPGAFQLTGGKLPEGINSINRSSMKASVWSPRIQTGMLGGGKGVGARGTLPTVNNTDFFTRAEVPYTRLAQPLQIWQTDYDAARKAAGGIGNLMKETAEIASEDMLRLVSTDLRTGNPGDATAQAADEWTSMLGLYTACDDHTTSGMEIYARRDRDLAATDSAGTTSYPLRAQTTDDATTAFSFSLIDLALRDSVTSRPNLVLADKTLFYGAIVPMADEKGHSAIYQPPGGSLPAFGMVGFKWDAVIYRGVTIIADPYATTSTMVAFNPNDFEVQIDPDCSFKTDKWYEGKQGENDALTSLLKLKVRMYCKACVNNRKWTALVP